MYVCICVLKNNNGVCKGYGDQILSSIYNELYLMKTANNSMIYMYLRV